jgi:hypothetical protein
VIPNKTSEAKEEITTLLKVSITKGNQTLKLKLKVDMKTLKEDILRESYTYTDFMTQDL